ncbi:tail fiber protein/ lysozyme [Vibrio phage D81]
MAATAIDELLIAIGFEVDDEQARDASSMMGSLSDEALKLGGILGAGLGLSELTFGFAGANDQLGKFADLQGVAVGYVDKLNYALQREGGSAGDAFREIENMNNMLGKLRAGDYGWTSELSRFGFDPKSLQQARNMPELLSAISEEFKDLDAQQRLQVSNILGMGTSMQRLAKMGPGGFSGYSAELEQRGTITDKEVKAAADFNDAVLNIQMTTRGFTKELSEVLLVNLTNSINQLDEAILSNKDVAFDMFEQYSDEIGDAFLGAAVLGAAGLATKMFKALGGLPNIILSYVVGNLASMWDWDADKVSKELGIDLPDWIFKPVEDLTQEDIFGPKQSPMSLTTMDPAKSVNRDMGFRQGYPVAAPGEIRQSSFQASPFTSGNVNQQPVKVEQNLHFTITEATDATATAQKVSEDVKSSTATVIKKLGGNVQ